MNHLECVTVRILADRELCSGCLMWSDDGKSLYCLTARHNLYIERIDVTTGKNMLQFASEITITSDCGCKQYSIINYFQEGGGDKEPTEGLDLTIFEIEQNEYTKDVPGTITAGYFSKEYDYKISGYPKIMNGDRAAINAEFNEEKGNGGLLFNLQNQNSTPFTKYNDILGISGSGCFQEVHRMYKFVGIENSTPNSLVPYNLVHCIPSTAINKLLSDNNLPLLPLPTPSYIDNKFGNYLTHNEVLGKAVYVNDWVKISSSDEIEKEINNLFSDENKDTNTLCLCGQSGIGKTRGVLEASKKFKHVIYYENYDTFRKESNIIMREFDEKGEPFKIIVDEVGYDKPQSVNSDFFSYPEIKIALIITVPKQKYPYNSMFVEIKACDDDVKKIVKKKFESSTYITADLAAVIADSIFSLCYNDLRLALLFSEIVERDPNKDIMRIQPSQMFSDFRTAEAILKKTIELHSADIPKDLDIRSCYEKLSLFVDIDYKGRLKEEINTLAVFFDQDVSCFLEAIDVLENISLGVKNEMLFSTSPRALARLAFEQNGWRHIKHRLKDFIGCLKPNTKMRKRFHDRLMECENEQIRSEVEEACASWFRDKYVTSEGLSALCWPNDASEAMLFIEYYPEIGLPWLKNRILAMTDVETKNFGGQLLSGKARREVVWLCEHLANFKEYFYDCEKILFKLALYECETGLSNNSHGVWSSYFSLFFANTEIPFDKRIDLLVMRLKNYVSGNNSEMFEKALGGMFQGSAFKTKYPQMIGGRITPDNWQPENLNDIITAKHYALNGFCNNFGDFPAPIQMLIIEQLIKNMNLIIYVSPALLEHYKNTLDKILKTQQQKNQMIQRLDWEINMAGRRGYGAKQREELQYLKNWREELRDDTLLGKIGAYLSRDIWSYGYSDEDRNAEEELVRSLSLEFMQLSNKLDELVIIIENERNLWASVQRFGEFIAFFDEKEEFADAVSSIIPCKFGESFFRGYFTGIYKRYGNLPSKYIEMLDSLAHDNPSFVLWASIALDISQEGYRRILSTINIAPDIGYVLDMRFEIWSNVLSENQKIELLEIVFSINKNHYRICFGLLHSWAVHSKTLDYDALYAYTFELFENCRDIDLNDVLYTVLEMFKEFPKKYECQVIRAAASVLDFDTTKYDNARMYSREFLLDYLDDKNADFILECIGERLLTTRKPSLFRVPEHGFFDSYPFEAVKKWIEASPMLIKEKVIKIVPYLSTPLLDNYYISELTKYVLYEYEDDDDVFNAFIQSRYNMVVTSLGERYEKRETAYSVLSQYSASELRRVREWACYEKRYLDGIVKDHKEMKAEDSRYE